MPKQAKSSIAKVRQTCQEYPDEFSATPAGDLRCNLCDVLVKCDKKFFVESHRKSKQHQGKLETKSKSQTKQTFLHFDQVNFKEQVVCSFLAADIPLHKLNHPSLKSLFARMGCLRRLQPGHVLLNWHPKKRNKFKNYFVIKKNFDCG